MTNTEPKFEQLDNKAYLVGELKSKEAKWGTMKTDVNVKTIALTLTVLTEVKNPTTGETQIHTNIARLWTKEGSKLYKGYEEIANNYKTKDENNGEGEYVMISGSMEMNQYVDRNNEVKTTNNFRGLFANRVDKNNMQEEAGLIVKGVVVGYSPIQEKGMLTGDYNVKFLTVGYGDNIHDIQNIIVKKDIANGFMEYCPINTTTTLTIRINRYAEVETTTVQSVTFGQQLNNNYQTTAKFVQELELIGATNELFKPIQLNEIQQMQLQLQNQEQIILSKGSTGAKPPQTNNSFGGNLHTDTSGMANVTTSDCPF